MAEAASARLRANSVVAVMTTLVRALVQVDEELELHENMSTHVPSGAHTNEDD